MNRLAKTLTRIKNVTITYIEDGEEETEKITVIKAGLGKWQKLTETLKVLFGILPEVLKEKGIEDIENYAQNMTYQDLILLLPDMYMVATNEVIKLLSIGADLEIDFIKKYVGIDEAVDLFEAISEVNNLIKIVEKGKNLIPLLNMMDKIRRK